MQSKINKRTVDAVRCGDHDSSIWDTETKWFGLKVTATGSRIYLLQARPWLWVVSGETPHERQLGSTACPRHVAAPSPQASAHLSTPRHTQTPMSFRVIAMVEENDPPPSSLLSHPVPGSVFRALDHLADLRADDRLCDPWQVPFDPLLEQGP